jgi:regulator of replication initiation timing
VLKEVVKLIKPLQKYVNEENELDVEILKLKSRMNTLQELILETQSDVVVLQKTKTDKRKRKR